MAGPSQVETRTDGTDVAGGELEVEAQRMHADLQQRMFGVTQDPVRIGRFSVLECIGSGGMGVVYAAYDPKLDRKIAVKLLHTGPAGTSGARALMTEAQALARLAHPNVIAVHDVGNIGDQVFIAMEYVEGVSLSRWNREGERSSRQILEAYVSAAEGLVAAHRAGLVHRDFKPDNVLIAEDGRVRVLDFGLARLVDAPDHEADGVAVEVASKPLSTPTKHRIAGTPAYMSPEQHLGETVDARSDQFSFCVALCEALYGEHPFGGDTAMAIAEAVLAGDLRAELRSSEVPRHVRNALVRGMSRVPEQRFPDMAELIVSLTPERGRRRGWRLAALGLLPLFVGVGYFAGVAGDDQKPCRGSERRLVGIWDAAAQSELEAAFLATNAPYAADATRSAISELDAFADSWQQVHREVCEATAIYQEQSVALMDVRMRCLERRLAGLEQLVKILRRADLEVVSNAVAAVGGLDRPHGCAIENAVEAAPDAPVVPRERDRELDELLARARALMLTGKYDDATESARAAIETSRQIGDDRRIAEALGLLARHHMHKDDAEAAIPLLDEAILSAERAGADRLRANALAELAMAHASQEQFASALRYGGFAGAAMERAGPSPRERVQLEAALGWLHLRAGKLAQANDHLVQALARIDALEREDELTAATAYNTLGVVHRDRGDEEAALESFERAREIRARVHGADHPETALVRYNIGTVLTQMERHADALESYRGALTVYERSVGPDCLDVGYAADAIAISLAELGRPEQALAHHHRAQRIFEARGLPARADLAGSLLNMGILFRQSDQPERALAVHEHALELWRERVGPDHIDLSYALVGIGEDLLALDRTDDAVAPFERAVGLREGSGMLPEAVAEARFGLAQAIRGTDPERARSLAELALDDYRRSGREDDVAPIEAFLARL